MGVNVGQVLRQAALNWPEQTGVVELAEPRHEHRFVELDAAARRVAAELAARGVGRGDTVALIAENSARFVCAWFGIVYAGAAVVPIPILSAAPEVGHRLSHARCRAIAFDSARTAVVRRALEGLEGVVLLPLETLGDDREPAAYPADTAPGDDAMILYTSGTTGTAKGAAISHASLLTHTAVLAHHALSLGTDDRILGVLPLTHSYGCRMVMLVGFFAGARCVLMPRFHAARSLAALRDEAISWLPAVPTMYAAWAAEPAEPAPPDPPPGASRLRWCLSAGAPLPDETARRAEARLGAEIRQGFGMTEATFTTLNAPPDERVLGSVGRPVWGIEVAVVDECGQPVPQGQAGELVVRGHNVMTRYLHDPDATAQVQAGGFLHSGDVGRLDREGRLYIVDRIKDLIIRGGNNVYPSEVEDALASHPAVREVAVVGRPDDYYGEEVVAIVVLRAGAQAGVRELSRWAAERVARTKVPREFAFVEALPLGPSGKVQKRELRAQLSAGAIVATPVSAQSRGDGDPDPSSTSKEST